MDDSNKLLIRLEMKRIIKVIAFITVLAGCSEQQELDTLVSKEQMDSADDQLFIDGELDVQVVQTDGVGDHVHSAGNERTTRFTETFESGRKDAYASGSVNLSSGRWTLSDALIGSTSSDRKYNSRSVRVRNTGYAIMSFNMDRGASTVSVRHARYGGDGNSSWRLVVSYDNGSSWQYAGGTINTTSTSLRTATFTINTSRSVRFGISKTGGGSNRINIDNFEVNTSSSGGGDDDGGGGSTGSASRDNNMTFGNPSNAGRSSNNYLVNRTDYAASYNNDRGTANWVSWHLSSAWRGSARRCNCFAVDTSLPSNFYRPSTSDYTGSGFDRGHLCPSADRTYSSAANRSTFYMTNIAPQAPDNNQRSWNSLENYCRTLASRGNELHIIAGVAGRGGSGRNGSASTIDGGRIDVPDSFWKVILVLPNGTNDVRRVSTSTRVIAVNIPNDQGISTSWGSYRTTVDNIERLTGYDLFENISNSIESTLESRVDRGSTN